MADPAESRAAELAAKRLGAVFRAMVDRGETREEAQRATLRCAIALLTRREGEARADRLDLGPVEAGLLGQAANEDWSRVHPGMFGTLFQAIMTPRDRHERGAHYTPEDAILEHVVGPSLVAPWQARIRGAASLEELQAIHHELTSLRVLDPACGTGNFLLVTLRALFQLERELLDAAGQRSPEARRALAAGASIQATQLFGIDIDAAAVELARVTLVLGERLSRREAATCDVAADEAPPSPERLTGNLVCDDALFCDWPAADLIVGNPPFQSKNKMQRELGPDYVRRVRERHPGVPGRADYCVYWFRRAHDELGIGARAGLVGTNTIRQNYSREGGLDHIVSRGGTITHAVSAMVWPGEAGVDVSIVNWINGESPGPKRLSWQVGDGRSGPLREASIDRIPASLSAEIDVTSAVALDANARAGACHQGQTHGHEGFLLSADEARALCAADPANDEVVFPYLIGEELLNEPSGAPRRWVIDLHPRSLAEAEGFPLPLQRLRERVLPAREHAAIAERARNEGLLGRGNRHHENFLRRWWLLGYPRPALVAKLGTLSRYIACSRVTKRPIFAFVSAKIRPGDALTVFALEDDYSFGVLQSSLHWAWLSARCSTLTSTFRYTSDTVFDTFPWPQAPSARDVSAVAEAAVALRAVRRELTSQGGVGLRALHVAMETQGRHPLADAQAALDGAVRAAHGTSGTRDPLAFLLDLGRSCAAREARGEAVSGPGLPAGVGPAGIVTTDAVEPEAL